MNSKQAFERGRNDKRDGRDNNCPAPFGSFAAYYDAGYEYQAGIMKNNKYSTAFEEGKNVAKKGEGLESNPHPANSKVWSSWNNGWHVWHMLH